MNKIIIKIAGVSLLILSPSIIYIVIVSIYRNNIVQWEMWSPFLFMGCSAFQGAYLYKQFNSSNNAHEYKEIWGRKMGTVLLSSGISMGLLSLLLGLVNYYYPNSILSIHPSIILWMLVMAILLPLDFAGLHGNKKQVICWSAVAAWGFCIFYPTYMFIRPYRSRYSGIVALLSIVVTLTGFVFGLLGSNNLIK